MPVTAGPVPAVRPPSFAQERVLVLLSLSINWQLALPVPGQQQTGNFSHACGAWLETGTTGMAGDGVQLLRAITNPASTHPSPNTSVVSTGAQAERFCGSLQGQGALRGPTPDNSVLPGGFVCLKALLFNG